MFSKIIKFLILILVLSFFVFVIRHYFSETNINLVKNNRNNLNINMKKIITELPVLQNDTSNVIKFKSDFDDSNKQNFKRNFWELFK